MKQLKAIKKRATTQMLDVEHLDPKRITLDELKKNRRWSLIWRVYNEKKKLFPELTDEVIIGMAKEQIIAIRQLSRLGFF